MQVVLSLFNKYGILVLFILVLLEYACLPLPSEILLPFLGYVADSNDYNLLAVISLSIIIGYLGSLICYFVGYYGGSVVFNKIYNKFPSWKKGLDATYNFFYKNGNLSVMIGRVIPLFRTYVSFFAGMFKQSLFRYSFYSILGISIWNFALIGGGYLLASNWNVISENYKSYKYALFLILLIIIFSFFAYKMYKKRIKTKNINGD
jgi:membrane protein DedA with SNARE-associated domain